MKFNLIICLCVAAASAGVIPWTKDGEDEALRLWKEYCAGSSDRGVDESRDVDWFCKRSPEAGREIVHPHTIDLGLQRQNKKQIVFIETPADHYKHDIVVTGQLEGNHKTNIVVIPGKDTHEINVKKDISVNVDSGKPAIFFVRNNDKREEIDSVPTPTGYPTKPPPSPVGLYQLPNTEVVNVRRNESRRTKSKA